MCVYAYECWTYYNIRSSIRPSVHPSVRVCVSVYYDCHHRRYNGNKLWINFWNNHQSLVKSIRNKLIFLLLLFPTQDAACKYLFKYTDDIRPKVAPPLSCIYLLYLISIRRRVLYTHSHARACIRNWILNRIKPINSIARYDTLAARRVF